jgi:hypothetical protein
MDGSRLKRLKVKLQIGDFQEMDQKQFNDLITNLSYLDQETVRHVIRNVPDLTEKVLNYFNQLNESTKIDLTDYMESMKSQQQILSDLMKEDIQTDVKHKIADELLEHSKWLRKEATLTRIFKMAISAIGLGLAFVFIQGMGNNTAYRPSHAKTVPGKEENGHPQRGEDADDRYGQDSFKREDGYWDRYENKNMEREREDTSAYFDNPFKARRSPFKESKHHQSATSFSLRRKENRSHKPSMGPSPDKAPKRKRVGLELSF